MPHNSALPEWVVLIATRSGRRNRTDRRPCHRRGRGDTLTVAGVPHLALGIDAPEGRRTPGTPEAAASDLDNHLWVQTLIDFRIEWGLI
jgi:endonuclease YncB( thermonuclease family)